MCYLVGIRDKDERTRHVVDFRSTWIRFQSVSMICNPKEDQFLEDLNNEAWVLKNHVSQK